MNVLVINRGNGGGLSRLVWGAFRRSTQVVGLDDLRHLFPFNGCARQMGVTGVVGAKALKVGGGEKSQEATARR